MTAEKLLNLYIDAHIILILSALIWVLVRGILRVTPLRRAFLPQLQMIYAVLTTLIVTPVLIAIADPRFGALNLSDFMVAQYLDGRIALNPTTFEHLLLLRRGFVNNLAMGQSPIALVLLGALMVGVIYYAVRTVRSLRSIHGLINRSYILRRMGRVDIRITDEAYVPFSTRGIRRHYVILPSNLLAHDNDVRVAIAHELQHVRQGDLNWEFLLEGLRILFFWNPALIFWKREVEHMRELACDQQVLRRKPFAVREYCDCLLRVCRSSLSGSLLAPTVPFAQLDQSRSGSRSAMFLRYRVVSMLHPFGGDPRAIFTFAVMAPIVCAVAMTVIATQRANDWSHDRLMLSTIVNLERLDRRNGLGQ